MRKKIRQREVKLRKNFLPTLIVNLFFWALIGGLVYFVEPDILGAVPLFFLLTFLALFFTFSLLFANSRRGFLAATGLTLFLLLRYFGVGNILNLLLISGIVLTLELFFARNGF